nr:MAG TPA: hypothetical protein [Caudoviricetes sp.]
MQFWVSRLYLKGTRNTYRFPLFAVLYNAI